MTIQARTHTRPGWRDTVVCVRLHTTAEICAVLDGHLRRRLRRVGDLRGRALRAARTRTRCSGRGGDVLATYERFYGADGSRRACKIPDAFLRDDGPGAALGRPRGGRAAAAAVPRAGSSAARASRTCCALSRARPRRLAPDPARRRHRHGPLGTLDARAARADGRRRSAHRRSSTGVPRARGRRRTSATPRVVVSRRCGSAGPTSRREALMHNRPLLATPVGGLLRDGRSRVAAAG